MKNQKLYEGIFLKRKAFKKNQFYYYIKTPKISIIIPKIKDKYLVISQNRIPINKITYEFPGGIVDKGQTILQTALKELREETGYCSTKKPVKLISFYADPGRLNCSYNCYFTNKIKKIGLPENGIKIHLLNKFKILNLIKQKKFSHSCHVASFLFLLNQKRYLSDK